MSQTCITCDWCIPRRVHYNGYKGPDCAHPDVAGYDNVYGRPIYVDCYSERASGSIGKCGLFGKLWVPAASWKTEPRPTLVPPPTKWEKFVAWLRVDRRPPFFEELTK